MKTFKQSVETEGNITFIRVEGYIDAHTAPELEKVLQDMIADGRYKVVLDFQQMEYISSAGLGVLMGAISTFRENQGDMKLVNLPSKVYKVFDLLGFSKLFEIFDNRQDAIAAFQEG